MPPLFTVIMPTHEHGYTLPYAVGSLQNQTCQDFELFIIGDGIDETTRAVITGLMKHDPRIRFFDFPKGERFGEIYRHQVLMEHARGELIAYHSDDDVLFPEHLEWLAEHLRDADFAHTMILDALMDGTVRTWFFQMRAVGQLDAMRRNTTGISLEGAAHTMAAYRRLPFGWRPAPKYHYSDLYMWLQWADMTWCRFASIPRISFVHFWSAPRKPWTPQERVAELAQWAARLPDPIYRQQRVQEAMDPLLRQLWFDQCRDRHLVAHLRDAVQLLTEQEPLPRSGLIARNVDFSCRGDGIETLLNGFCAPDESGSWTTGDRASVMLTIPITDQNILMRLNYRAFVAPPDQPLLSVRILANRSHIATRCVVVPQSIETTEVDEWCFTLPHEVHQGRDRVFVEFLLDTVRSTREVEIPDDPRRFGLMTLTMESVRAQIFCASA